MQRCRSVSFSKSEFEIARVALTQASRLAGSRLHYQILSPASVRSRPEFWCPGRLRKALASESDGGV